MQVTNYGIHVIFGDAGFRPGEQGPFVSAKGPKTMVAVAWPFGCPCAMSPTPAARKLAALKQCAPSSEVGNTTWPRHKATGFQ